MKLTKRGGGGGGGGGDRHQGMQDNDEAKSDRDYGCKKQAPGHVVRRNALRAPGVSQQLRPLLAEVAHVPTQLLLAELSAKIEGGGERKMRGVVLSASVLEHLLEGARAVG
jgi:hypothetical protein